MLLRLSLKQFKYRYYMCRSKTKKSLGKVIANIYSLINDADHVQTMMYDVIDI